MLHIIKHLEKISLVSAYLLPGDAVLLTENAVYAAAAQSPYPIRLNDQISWAVLHEDLQARGWLINVDPRIHITTMSDFVELTITHEKSITW
ncbi:sulfurtransferase complex subunit TusB [Vibrio metoecus]|uniref:sulfurtransferase complex subunit TusB n=1 Tax=Vibrio metoecus TaxID=1481663 RepID=UPI000BA9A938|nr:sulfurtransferase complex subunit TusB [Vibrio metoecus]PAR45033.1 sulfurtransferase complex subunit TusB [Vibrio metoecus]